MSLWSRASPVVTRAGKHSGQIGRVGDSYQAAIARIFVPSPRRVEPTANPFSPPQTWHRQRLLPTSACLSSKDALPTAALFAQLSRSHPLLTTSVAGLIGRIFLR